MGTGGFFQKNSAPLSLMTTYRMSPISTGSISLDTVDSTFKLLKDRGPIRVYTEETFEASLTHRQSYSPTLHPLLSQLLSAVTHIEPDNDNLGVFFCDVTTLALDTTYWKCVGGIFFDVQFVILWCREKGGATPYVLHLYRGVYRLLYFLQYPELKTKHEFKVETTTPHPFYSFRRVLNLTVYTFDRTYP
jgi:hypothetical protein